ncbi:Non-specific serine/threonine protein kinase protein [Dioscorea alata]|uniref:Non-specific serine/threonine protein kinase protein n=1 Tax=Dioscorea alata TaxID=55571 RepID=A0ACB7VD84_DIOAL|nr:Non-specific serine/threonine protein kinase protein [Dioscorea alata]
MLPRDEVEGNHYQVAVAIDKDKNSQNALKWAVDNLLRRGQTLTLLHVLTKPLSNQEDAVATVAKELFLPFRCFCTRKDVQCKDVVLEDTDVAKAISEFVAHHAIEKLVIGATSRSGFVRFKSTDLPANISKSVPDFCSVYVVSKGKLSSTRNAIRPAPNIASLASLVVRNVVRACRTRSPFSRGVQSGSSRSSGEFSITESDISFVSSHGRSSVDPLFPGRLSNASEGFMTDVRNRFMDSFSSGNDFSSISHDNSHTQSMEDIEAEMKRLRLELKQTMDMYSTACKEALTAKQKAMELQRLKMEEEQRLEEARVAEEVALSLAEKERAKCKAAMEAAEASQRIAKLEAQKRIVAERKAQEEADERQRAMNALSNTDIRYRKYTIEEIEAATENFSEDRKIGEGGYGPVYKCNLDHTPVAVKVLRPDAAQGRSQFQQEVEILSCIRHPNMVLLLGACPEFGCLVYEYMANGSLEDRLFRRGGTPPIPWQHRFRIAAEIGTGLLFLHQTKPEPLVHRDLKPANILLDRNYVSKISDVGLARLVPPSVANSVTQYRMTSTAGTFCYIDPEYQQTGMLGIKSDIYSLGVMLLQMVTAKSPMGLTHYVDRAIEKGTFEEMLDPTVKDWPVDEAMNLCKLALKCAELRRKDRPDLANVVLPELDKLRNLAEANMNMLHAMPTSSPTLQKSAKHFISNWTMKAQHAIYN